MALLFILLVIAGGMGLSVEAGLLGPLASQVGIRGQTHEHLWDWRSVNLFSDVFFSPRSCRRSFSLPRLATHRRSVGGGVHVVILTMATPVIGIAMTMIGILAGQVAKSLAIDHYGLFRQPTAQNRSAARHGADVDYGGVTAGGSGLRRGNGYDSDHSGTVRRLLRLASRRR